MNLKEQFNCNVYIIIVLRNFYTKLSKDYLHKKKNYSQDCTDYIYTKIFYTSNRFLSFIFVIVCDWIWNKLFRGANKVEDAVDCYQRAANLFKMAKKWSQAGNAFCEAAGLHGKAGSRHDAATNFVDAANCYKKSDVNGEILKSIDSNRPTIDD